MSKKSKIKHTKKTKIDKSIHRSNVVHIKIDNSKKSVSRPRRNAPPKQPTAQPIVVNVSNPAPGPDYHAMARDYNNPLRQQVQPPPPPPPPQPNNPLNQQVQNPPPPHQHPFHHGSLPPHHPSSPRSSSNSGQSSPSHPFSSHFVDTGQTTPMYPFSGIEQPAEQPTFKFEPTPQHIKKGLFDNPSGPYSRGYCSAFRIISRA